MLEFSYFLNPPDGVSISDFHGPDRLLKLIVLQNDRSDECLKVLKRIHADAQDPDGQFATREHHTMQQQFALDSTHLGGSYRSLLFERHNLKRVLLGFTVMFGAQGTGTLVINSEPLAI